MPASKKVKKQQANSNGNRPVTRSRIKDPELDITTYTTLQGNKPDHPIQVVSKRGLKSDPRNYAELEKRFERIEAKRKLKDLDDDADSEKIDTMPISPDLWQRRDVIFAVTHFNVFLYATCFFIQVGTMPVNNKNMSSPYPRAIC